MSKSEYKKLRDEWLRCEVEFEKAFNTTFDDGGNLELRERMQKMRDKMRDETCIVMASEPQHNCILDSAWDTAKSFVSGIIWIFIILCIIGLIFG